MVNNFININKANYHFFPQITFDASHIYTPHNEVVEGYTGFTMSVRL
jgi:hypothetical protein